MMVRAVGPCMYMGRYVAPAHLEGPVLCILHHLAGMLGKGLVYDIRGGGCAPWKPRPPARPDGGRYK